MYVCMYYVYMYVCMYECMYVCMYACMYVRMCVYMYSYVKKVDFPLSYVANIRTTIKRDGIYINYPNYPAIISPRSI